MEKMSLLTSEKSFLAWRKNTLKHLGRLSVRNLCGRRSRRSSAAYSAKSRVRFWEQKGQR